MEVESDESVHLTIRFVSRQLSAFLAVIDAMELNMIRYDAYLVTPNTQL